MWYIVCVCVSLCANMCQLAKGHDYDWHLRSNHGLNSWCTSIREEKLASMVPDTYEVGGEIGYPTNWEIGQQQREYTLKHKRQIDPQIWWSCARRDAWCQVGSDSRQHCMILHESVVTTSSNAGVWRMTMYIYISLSINIYIYYWVLYIYILLSIYNYIYILYCVYIYTLYAQQNRHALCYISLMFFNFLYTYIYIYVFYHVHSLIQWLNANLPRIIRRYWRFLAVLKANLSWWLGLRPPWFIVILG